MLQLSPILLHSHHRLTALRAGGKRRLHPIRRDGNHAPQRHHSRAFLRRRADSTGPNSSVYSDRFGPHIRYKKPVRSATLYGQSLSVALAHYFIRRYAVRTTHDPEYGNGMPAVRLNRVLDFMRQNYSKETRLWELANLAGMSPHYFCELFKQSTGISPYQYSLRCRMDRAKEFLRSPQFTVRQVAEATGFADQSHFTKVFRRMVGVTPLQFRVNRPNIGFSRQLRAECA
jgi:AraC-like DNA-binding protein